MDLLLPCLRAFLAGGALCAIGQLLIDRTGLTPARILTAYVVAGVVLGASGLYAPFAGWAGAGAAVPLTGFGNTIACGVREAVAGSGVLGALTGALSSASAGISAAIAFGFLAALILKSHEK